MIHRIARFFRRAKTDIMIGAMGVLLYALLGFAFFYLMSFTNSFLMTRNRTTATTLFIFAASCVAMHAVYGGYDVGQKKNKPVISALISGIAVTDLITYIQFEIMNTNKNNNATLVLFSSDLLYLLACFVIQVLIIILFVRLGNQLSLLCHDAPSFPHYLRGIPLQWLLFPVQARRFPCFLPAFHLP